MPPYFFFLVFLRPRIWFIACKIYKFKMKISRNIKNLAMHIQALNCYQAKTCEYTFTPSIQRDLLK
jgi:hypothetical protein